MILTRAQQVVQALHQVFGYHEGCRAVHARGQLLTGEFRPAPAAMRLCRALHLRDRAVPVTARFSNGNGHPAAPDFLPDVRGLAVSFHLPDGQRTDIVAASLPRFPVRSPEGFLALARAVRPRLTLPLRMLGFLLRHPEFLAALPANARALWRPPASYATLRYYAIHAYKWISPYGGERYVRYRWQPEQEQKIAWWRALVRGPRYLGQELRDRLRRGPIRMHLQVQIARPGDAVSDPSAPWPEERELVTVGTLELLALAAPEEDLVFDPARLTDGIALSPDPVLQFRTEAYAVSAGERGARHRPQHIKVA